MKHISTVVTAIGGTGLIEAVHAAPIDDIIKIVTQIIIAVAALWQMLRKKKKDESE